MSRHLLAASTHAAGRDRADQFAALRRGCVFLLALTGCIAATVLAPPRSPSEPASVAAGSR